MSEKNGISIIAETDKDTVAAKYERVARAADAYQSEAELERELISLLEEQGYERFRIRTEADMVANLQAQLEALNGCLLTDGEWERFFRQDLANGQDGIVEKARCIQEDPVRTLTRDDGSSKNIRLLDRANIHNNRLQVTNQYAIGKEAGAAHDNRYDVTILVNGLPLVHIELKRRGVPIREAFNQINRYQRESFWAGSGLFEYVQLFVISNGTHTKYYSNTTRQAAVRQAQRGGVQKKAGSSFEFTSFWATADNGVLPDLIDFARTFFAKHTLLNVLTRYCVFTAEQKLLVMRPYQIAATERALNRIALARQYKLYGTRESGGYIWHTTGSGKTLTSFKCAQLASQLPYIDKVLFVVDRKDLDYQTMQEYDRFEKGCANSNASSAVLKRQLEDDSGETKIIITTIQKLDALIKRNPDLPAYGRHTVFIFDECHRSQFGDMHQAVTRKFKNYYLFGFTGTPIFAQNATKSVRSRLFTTEQTFGRRLHSYTIVDAINDKNVLPFRVDYIKTIDKEEELEDEEVWDIDREQAFLAPERIRLVTAYILKHFDKKTYRSGKAYAFRALANVRDVATAKRKRAEEVRQERRLQGFNSILATASVEAAKLYYREFKRQMAEDPNLPQLRVATIFSFHPNEAEAEGLLDEENPEDTQGLDAGSREFLEGAIRDYNGMFSTNYSTDADKFQNYYKDVSLRMKNKELDLLIVVNMFLTGFDAPTLNTLWVDKNLKAHGLIQAFSRTNRILNSVKAFGNVVCFRPLSRQVDEAIALFGDKEAGGVVLLRTFEDYFYGYTDEDGRRRQGYEEMTGSLKRDFPLQEPRIEGERRQKDFIKRFGAVLRMRNLLSSFDEFEARDTLRPRDLQDYLGRYQDLRDEWKALREAGEKADIEDDLVFETELVQQIDINIDYILMLVQKYHEENGRDAEILVTIERAVNASPELRSKKELIEEFIQGLNRSDDVMREWYGFVERKREEDLQEIIDSEKLRAEATRKFMAAAFRKGELRTIGTDMDAVLPPVSRLGGKRAAKKRAVQAKLQAFFEKYRGIGCQFSAEGDEERDGGEDSYLEAAESAGEP